MLTIVVMQTHDDVRNELGRRLDVLARRAGRIEADLRRVLDPDWAEQAADAENDEVLTGLDALTRVEVREIHEAVRRIDTGRYGTCTSCGHAISPERLAALPATPLCVACAARTEREA